MSAYHCIKDSIIAEIENGGLNVEKYVDSAQQLFNTGQMEAEQFHDIMMLVRSVL